MVNGLNKRSAELGLVTINIIYIDYSKAFDSVCHSKQLQIKLQAHGICGNLLRYGLLRFNIIDLRP